MYGVGRYWSSGTEMKYRMKGECLRVIEMECFTLRHEDETYHSRTGTCRATTQMWTRENVDIYEDPIPQCHFPTA